MFKKIFLGLLLGLVLGGKVVAQGVDYYLPYPGILPDHPLYWLKMVRDRAGLLVTTGKTAKAEKLLLYADKRLGAAWALIDGNKVPLGVSTLTKGEKYLEQAVQLRDSFADKNKLDKAVKKHLEVLAILKEKTGSYTNLVGEMTMKLEAANSQLPVKSVIEASFSVTEATTVYAVLEKAAKANNWELLIKDYDFGKLVVSISGTANSEYMAWIYYVNGGAGDKAADKFKLVSGDKVEWKYEAVKP